MRVVTDEVDFAKYLLTLGNGTAPVHPEVGDDMIQILQEYLVNSLDELIEKVFPGIEHGYADKLFVSHRAILTPINDNVHKINEIIMKKFPGEGQTYLSADSVAEDDLHNTYPTDFLNSVTVSGMPSHAMTLKVGAPVMLLWISESRSWKWTVEWNSTHYFTTQKKSDRSRNCKRCKQGKICVDSPHNNCPIRY